MGFADEMVERRCKGGCNPVTHSPPTQHTEGSLFESMYKLFVPMREGQAPARKEISFESKIDRNRTLGANVDDHVLATVAWCYILYGQ